MTGSSAPERASTSTPPQQPWSRKFYRMYDYVLEELRQTVLDELSRGSRIASASSATPWAGMGRWCWRCAIPRSSSRCRPLRRSAPRRAAPGARRRCRATWARITAAWKDYDAAELMTSAGQARVPRDPGRPGTGGQVPAPVATAARTIRSCLCGRAQPLRLRRHEGYDHGYYFISTFVEDHLRFHAAALGGI